jgi:hypothetical protein
VDQIAGAITEPRVAVEINKQPSPGFRGYACADITQTAMTARFRVVSDVTIPNATVSTLMTFAVEDGHPGAIAT